MLVRLYMHRLICTMSIQIVVQVSPVTTCALGSTNLIRDIRETRTNNLRGA